jgi:hypothetical protein
VKSKRSLSTSKWSRNYDKCVVCESDRYPHIEDGLCSKCHHQIDGKQGIDRMKVLQKLRPKTPLEQVLSTGRIDNPKDESIKVKVDASTSKPWSRKYERCIRCGENETRHVAQGLCARCYEEEANSRNRGYRSSGQRYSKKLTEQYLHKEYVEKKRSAIDIAIDSGYTRQGVGKALKKYGIEIRNQSEASELAFRRGKKIVKRIDDQGKESFTTLEKTDLNENFFSSWSPQMAYVLGLFYTDGHVDPGWKREPERKSHRQASVRISQKEPELLEKISTLMKTNARFRYRKQYQYEHTVAGALYTLEFVNEKLYEDLFSLGVTPRKSLTLTFPDVPTELVGHFLRGCWDGDGTVHFSNRNKAQHYAGIVSGSREFIQSIADQLYTEGILNVIDHTPIRIHPNGEKSFDIRVKGKQNLGKLFHYLYDGSDSAVRLDRKYLNFISILDSYNEKTVEIDFL